MLEVREGTLKKSVILFWPWEVHLCILDPQNMALPALKFSSNHCLFYQQIQRYKGKLAPAELSALQVKVDTLDKEVNRIRAQIKSGGVNGLRGKHPIVLSILLCSTFKLYSKASLIQGHTLLKWLLFVVCPSNATQYHWFLFITHDIKALKHKAALWFLLM